ncbi:MerR family transcriptional regulator [Paraconexibacter antarcticus]|uniref:MerR family transcriptional regulator n=1 Tax=Paraconexibacter antarcticus TaxID=2949664 RepID=A0ABY5DS85_9ACTN|nr:MerR family transcriptional regulator [Paraconexibacter antarcticus]UTI64459.1 MerR family transcriptional regulator [Paraconexibacter antarcticus]
MPAIRTNAAAAMLGVSPNTLRSWERRFGFPEPRRTAGGHRQFDLAEVEALRSAFEETHNVSSAISIARERGAGPATPARLKSAFNRFDDGEADRIVEESLTVRSMERTVEEVMLPSVAALDEDGLGETAEFGFAWRWTAGWLAAQQRVAPPASRPSSVLLFDASRPVDMDALHAQALELVLRRSGLRTLTLTATLDPNRLTHALTALDPRIVVLTGRRASLDELGRLVFAVRRACGDRVTVLDYRGALSARGGISGSTVASLGDQPLAARELVLAHVDGRADTLGLGDAESSAARGARLAG